MLKHSMRAALVVAVVCALAAPANAANPTANAGADQTIAYGSLPALVTLSGSGVDPDGGAITAYSWTTVDVPPGSAATLSATNVASPTFTADVVGTYRFCLQVTDSSAETNGTDFLVQPTAACTNVMATTAFLGLVLPAKGQRNTFDLVNVWPAMLDLLAIDFDDFTAAIASTSSGAEGAALVGTDAKANLGGGTTVEAVLEWLDAAFAAGTFLPLAGGTMVGDVLFDVDNAYDLGGATEAAASVWTRIVDSTAALALGGTGATSVGVGHAGIATTITGNAIHLIGATDIGDDLTMSGDIHYSGDATFSLGTSSVAALSVWSRAVSSNGAMTIGTPVQSAGAGYAVAIAAGTGADAAGATPGYAGGALTCTSGKGGAAGAALAAGDGQTATIRGGQGGDGSATNAGGDGGATRIYGGLPGITGGGGPGAGGAIYIGTDTDDGDVTIGNGTASIALGSTTTLASGHSLLFEADANADIGDSTHAGRILYARTIHNGTGTDLLVEGSPGAATVDGSTLHLSGGLGGASDGVSPAGKGGQIFVVGANGGAGSGAQAPGAGAKISILPGRGGTGTATVIGGTGGDVTINAGAPGASGGFGAGSPGAISIGTLGPSAIAVGAAGVTTTISGTANLPTTWQINSTTVNATAANLNTLVGGTSSIGDSLHRHAFPVDVVGSRGQTTNVTNTESATIAYWTLPNATAVSVRCKGICATSGTNDAVCSLRWKDEAGVEVVTIPIPDASCGDGATALANGIRFDVTFSAASLTSDFGSWHYVTDNEGGNCYFAGVTCWAY